MLTCPTCGEENPPNARFCLNCGTALAGVAPSEATAPGTPSTGSAPLGEERKIVTVMFCDLAGFTARSDRADPEDVKATLRPYHARVKREIEHHGGVIDKFLGDGVVAVFGAPAAHEDDPERAIRCGLRIQDAMADLNRSDANLALRVRIGIATGEAVVSLGRGPQIGERITGEVVSDAERLQAVAPEGGIVVSEPAFRATQARFEFEELGLLDVGGGSARPLWRPLRLRASLGVDVEHRSRPAAPFIGRRDEVGQLKAAFHRAMQERSIQLVTISGEAGVGKSRLIGELFAYVDELPEIYQWRQGRCLSYGEGVTFSALGEIVKAQAGILDSDTTEEAMAKLAGAVATSATDPAEREWLTTRLATVSGRAVGMEDGAPGGAERAAGGMAAAFDRTESFAAWRRFLTALALERPAVLVFEDLHWADGSMLDFIAELADSGVAAPLLVLCAARPQLFERRPDWGQGRRNAVTIPLAPLSEPETAMLLSALLDRAVLPAETQTLLLERAGGNPLYAEEFVRMLRDQDFLEQRGRVLTLRAGAEVAVPLTLQALIAARIDALPSDPKDLLYSAAVLGKVFWAGAIAAMEDEPEGEIVRRLEDLGRTELVRRSATSSLGGETEYTFWHLLVRDVAYSQIPRAARAERHRAAASWIERVSRERAADQSELLAYHYAQALELTRASHQPDAARALESQLLRFLITAGDKAMRLNVAEAASYFRRALELVAPVPGRPPSVIRARLLARAAEAALLAGRLGEAQADYQAAIEGFRQAHDEVGEAGAMAMLSRPVHKHGDTVEARHLLERAIEMLERHPPGRELARAYSRYAGLTLLAGRDERSAEVAGTALELAERLGMEDEVVRSLQFLGAARLELGDDAGLEDLRKALDLGLRLGLGEEVAIAYGNLAYQLWLRDGPAAGLEIWEASLRFCQSRGFEAQVMWGHAGRLEVLFDLGRWDEVLAIADVMGAWDRERGGSQVGTFAAIYRANVLMRRDRPDEAADLHRQFLPEVRKMEHAEFMAPATVIAAQVELARGDRTGALGLVREFASCTEDSPAFRCLYLADAARTAVAAGDLRLAGTLPPDTAHTLTTRHRLGLLTGQGVLAEAAGEAHDAGVRYADAAAGWREYGSRLELAQALMGRARIMRRSGDADRAQGPAAAAGLAAEAAAIFRDLGARRLALEAERLGGERSAISS